VANIHQPDNPVTPLYPFEPQDNFCQPCNPTPGICTRIIWGELFQQAGPKWSQFSICNFFFLFFFFFFFFIWVCGFFYFCFARYRVGNQILGKLPSEWSSFPFVASLYVESPLRERLWSNLVSYHRALYDNFFTGTLPSDWSSMPSLHSLSAPLISLSFGLCVAPNFPVVTGGFREISFRGHSPRNGQT